MRAEDQTEYIISYPDYRNFIGILTNVFKHTKNFINPLPFFLPTYKKIGEFDHSKITTLIFTGRIVLLPYFKIIDPEFEKYQRFEEFTKENEVNNIALWVLAGFKYLSRASNLSLGKELEILQSENPRDGRLDVVALKAGTIVIVETKTDLRSALAEKRFLYQVPNYDKECQVLMGQYRKESTTLVLLGIGGEETDLFPPNHPDCTSGSVGQISKIFYDKISEKNIRFVSANALWCLVAYQYLTNKKIDLIDLLISIFSNKEVVGFLSGGIVIKEGKDFIVRPISLSNF